MPSVVEESFAPRLVVDNTRGEGRPMAEEKEFFMTDYTGTETIIESPALFNALTGEEGFGGL